MRGGEQTDQNVDENVIKRHKKIFAVLEVEERKLEKTKEPRPRERGSADVLGMGRAWQASSWRACRVSSKGGKRGGRAQNEMKGERGGRARGKFGERARFERVEGA